MGTAFSLWVIQILDADDLRPLKLLKDAAGSVLAIQYSPPSSHTRRDCGHIMAAASRDLYIYLYDVHQSYQVF